MLHSRMTGHYDFLFQNFRDSNLVFGLHSQCAFNLNQFCFYLSSINKFFNMLHLRTIGHCDFLSQIFRDSNLLQMVQSFNYLVLQVLWFQLVQDWLLCNMFGSSHFVSYLLDLNPNCLISIALALRFLLIFNGFDAKVLGKQHHKKNFGEQQPCIS